MMQKVNKTYEAFIGSAYLTLKFKVCSRPHRIGEVVKNQQPDSEREGLRDSARRHDATRRVLDRSAYAQHP